ncbi:hypothetical protein CCYA_CCYA05G1634 [Cyanidiococcus yangmingshanensis]|nr:hypothetical protein CCYA_CCYA05G1634 [Cyanidiococcus yangmingshanensis]
MFSWTKDTLDWIHSWVDSSRHSADGPALGASAIWDDQTSSGTGLRTLVIDGKEYMVWAPPLAAGGYATVFAASEVGCGVASRETASFVVKETRYGEHEQVRQSAEKEVAIYRYIESQRMQGGDKDPGHVVRFRGSAELDRGERVLYVLLERINGGSLAELFAREALALRLLPEPRWLQIAYDLLRSLQFLHSLQPHAIVHSDIKLENVLYDPKSGHWLLCDLASAQLIPQDRSEKLSTKDRQSSSASKQHSVSPRESVGEVSAFEAFEAQTTWWYRAPETIDVYTSTKSETLAQEKQDIWACGCVLFTLAYGFHPFADSGMLQILSGAPWHRVPASRRMHYSGQVEQLLLGLLALDVEQRWSAHQALAFLDGLHDRDGAFSGSHGMRGCAQPSRLNKLPDETGKRESIDDCPEEDNWADFSALYHGEHHTSGHEHSSEEPLESRSGCGFTAQTGREAASSMERAAASDESSATEPIAWSSVFRDSRDACFYPGLREAPNHDALSRDETSYAPLAFDKSSTGTKHPVAGKGSNPAMHRGICDAKAEQAPNLIEFC